MHISHKQEAFSLAYVRAVAAAASASNLPARLAPPWRVMTATTDLLRVLKPQQVATWLCANGWTLVKSQPEHTSTWRKASAAEGDFVVDLPLNTAFRDYVRRMSEIVDTLVVSSGKPAASVLAEVREGARLLRATGATPDFEVEGAVVRLDSTNPAAGGVAIVAGQVDGHARKLRIPMEATDYALAIRAHQDGLLLRCEGELIRQGTGFQLQRVRHVAVVADDD